MRISDWSSDVCSSDLGETFTLEADQVFKAIGQKFLPDDVAAFGIRLEGGRIAVDAERRTSVAGLWAGGDCIACGEDLTVAAVEDGKVAAEAIHRHLTAARSEEHTSELQSLMRISYAVFCLKKKIVNNINH